VSFKHLHLVVEYSTTKGPDRAIMLVLAHRANEAGECWPGLDKLAKDAGLSRSTVIRRLPVIVSAGELVIQRQSHTVQTRGGRQAANLYRVTCHEAEGGSTQTPPADTKGVAESFEGGSRVTPKGGSTQTQRG
jgi:hypothetical protein